MRTVRREGRPVRPSQTRQTVEDYWQKWWASEVIVGKSRATQYSYRSTYLAHIRRQLGPIKLSRLIDNPQLLVAWRGKLSKDKAPSAVEHAHRVLSSMLSAAAEDEIIPHNPLLLISLRQRRGSARRVTRPQVSPAPVAIDLAAWFLALEYLRRPTRPALDGEQPRTRRYPLDRERDALILALGFMAGYRLPSEALGLTVADVHEDRLYMEGRSSAGEYLLGSKTGPGRDLPLRGELAEVFEHVKQAYEDSGIELGPKSFWIASRRDGGVWTGHQATLGATRSQPGHPPSGARLPAVPSPCNATTYGTTHLHQLLPSGAEFARCSSRLGAAPGIAMISRKNTLPAG